MFDTEKPSLEELQHFGTKGMKWGVHKTRGTAEFHKQFTTPQARATEIRRARASVKKSNSAVNKAPRNSAQRNKLAKANLKNPDRATALRLTKGEKIVHALLYVAVPIPVVPIAVAGNTAYRVGKRRHLEP